MPNPYRDAQERVLKNFNSILKEKGRRDKAK